MDFQPQKIMEYMEHYYFQHFMHHYRKIMEYWSNNMFVLMHFYHLNIMGDYAI